MEEEKIKNIKKTIINTIVFAGLAHGVFNDLIYPDQSDDFGDFGGNYVMKNSDSSGTAVAFNIIPSIIDIN